MFGQNPFSRPPADFVRRSLTPEEKIHFDEFLDKVKPDAKYSGAVLVEIFNSTCGTHLTQDELRDIKEIFANFYTTRYHYKTKAGKFFTIDIYIKNIGQGCPIFLTSEEIDSLMQYIDND